MNKQKILKILTGLESPIAIFAKDDDFLYLYKNTVAGATSVELGHHYLFEKHKLFGVYDADKEIRAMTDINGYLMKIEHLRIHKFGESA